MAGWAEGAMWCASGAALVVVHGAAHFRVACGAANAPGDTAATVIGRLTCVASAVQLATAECQFNGAGATATANTTATARRCLLWVMVVLMLMLMAATAAAGLMCRWLIAAGVVMVRR